MMMTHRIVLKTHPLLTTHVRSIHCGAFERETPKGAAPAGLVWPVYGEQLARMPCGGDSIIESVQLVGLGLHDLEPFA